MSQRTRLLLAGLAVVVLVVAFVIASGSGGDDDGGQQADNPPATAPSSTPATTPVEPGATTPTASAEPAAPLIRVVGGQPEGGVKRLEFTSGDRVRFRVRSDVAEEIHVHGYDIARDVTPGETLTMSFDGDIEGRFDVELEHSGVQIAELEVAP